MKAGMVKTLESRIAQMKEFNASFATKVEGVITQVDELGITINPADISEDKSVRYHVRKRTQNVNNVIARFKRDLRKAVTDLTAVETVEDNQ